MLGPLPLEVELMLAGFGGATAVVLFVDDRARRAVMAFGLFCALGIALVQILGPARFALVILVGFLARSVWRDWRGRKATPRVSGPRPPECSGR